MHALTNILAASSLSLALAMPQTNPPTKRDGETWTVSFSNSLSCSTSTAGYGDETADGYDCVALPYADGVSNVQASGAIHQEGGYAVFVYNNTECDPNLGYMQLVADVCTGLGSAGNIKAFAVVDI